MKPTATENSWIARMQFLKELVEAHGAPGFEGDVAAVMEKHLKGVGTISARPARQLHLREGGRPEGAARHARRATSTRSASW